VILARFQAITQSVQRPVSVRQSWLSETRFPKHRLAQELHAFTSALIEPDAPALYRLIVADGWRFPYLARVFDQSGPTLSSRMTRRAVDDSAEPNPGKSSVRRRRRPLIAIAAGLFVSGQQIAQSQTAARLAAGDTDLVAPRQR